MEESKSKPIAKMDKNPGFYQIFCHLLTIVDWKLSNAKKQDPRFFRFSPAEFSGFIKITIFFWRVWTIRHPTQESGSTICPFESSGTFWVEKDTLTALFRNGSFERTIWKQLSFLWLLSSWSFLTHNQYQNFPILVQQYFWVEKSVNISVPKRQFWEHSFKTTVIVSLLLTFSLSTHNGDPQSFHLSPAVVCELKKNIIFIPHMQFRETNTSLHIENCRTTPSWRKATQNLLEKWIKTQELMKYSVIYWQLWTNNFPMQRIRIHNFSFLVERRSLGWKNNSKIFIPSRQKRETNTPLQIQKISDNAVIDESESN